MHNTHQWIATLLPIALALMTAVASSAQEWNHVIADGWLQLRYDRGAWATNPAFASYTDIHGLPTGKSGPTADVDGERWIFPQRLEGVDWTGARYPVDYLIPLTDNIPLTQPTNGFRLPVNTSDHNHFAAGHKVTDYNSTTNPHGYIGLGGSWRIGSDFNEPGASVWWEHLALRQGPLDTTWRLIATSGAGQGSIFELTNVATTVLQGKLHLSADLIWGDTDWLRFLQDVNGHLDTTVILGHIELIPIQQPDLNQDGWTDALDAGLLFEHWGQSGLGDLNADNLVDAADAGEMFEQWTGVVQFELGEFQAVPETSRMLTPIALVLSTLGWGSWRPRRSAPR